LKSQTKIKNIKKLLKTPVEEMGEYDVESELIPYAQTHTLIFLERYKADHPKIHWTHKQERNTYVGLLGQKIFHLICQQFNIPVDYNDPLLDWRQQKNYDFKLANQKTIEVKCFDRHDRKVLIKKSEWHGNDYLVVFRLADEKPSIVHLEGYLTKQQVENLPVSEQGEFYTPYASAYICDFTDLNPTSKFIEVLMRSHVVN